MKMRSYSLYVIEAWATWEVLRRLGFEADHIFWEFVNTAGTLLRPGIALNVALRAQDKTFIVTCSERLSEGEARRLESESRKFQEALTAGKFDEAEMNELLHASIVWKNHADFLVALLVKGFVFPYKMD